MDEYKVEFFIASDDEENIKLSSLNEKDMDFADKLKALFVGETEVCTDKTIKIGGLKGYCKALSIVADETLDSKLGAQREWFIENSGLSVL